MRLPFRPIVGAFLMGGATATALVSWALVVALGFVPLVAFLAAINLATFGAYAYDKAVARREGPGRLRRVPETVLHALALAGGSPAAFAGQKLLRHKTLKQPFRSWFWAIVVVQVVCLSAWVYHSGV